MKNFIFEIEKIGYMIFLFLPVIFLSCSDEQIINPLLYPMADATAGLKSKVYYSAECDTLILKTYVYEYSPEGMVNKINYYGGDRLILYYYEIFNYNDEGRLHYKLHYHSNINSSSGFKLLDSTAYLYSGFLLISETIFYLPYTDEYRYDYRNNFVYRKTKYHNAEKEYYTVYQYKSDQLHKEISYTNDDIMFKWQEYYFRGSLLTKIIAYDHLNQIQSKTEFIYNEYGKLVLEKFSDLPVFSSMTPYIVKYIY